MERLKTYLPIRSFVVLGILTTMFATDVAADSCGDNTPHVVNQCDSSNKKYEMWYFDGTIMDGSPYRTQMIVETNGFATDYWWFIEGNTDAIRFVDNSTAIYTGSSNWVALYSYGLSNSESGDVFIRWGNQYGYRSPRRKLVVRAPDKMKRKNTVIRGRNLSHLWRTHIFYEIRDQFNRVLPARVGVNEYFTTFDISDTPGGDNWNPGPQGGDFVNPANWSDNITVTLNYATKRPPAIEPTQGGPYSATKVDHWRGDWRCGTNVPGLGRPLRNGLGITWQHYLDHANHE